MGIKISGRFFTNLYEYYKNITRKMIFNNNELNSVFFHCSVFTEPSSYLVDSFYLIRPLVQQVRKSSKNPDINQPSTIAVCELHFV